MEWFLTKSSIDDILRGKSGELASKKNTAEKKMTHARTKSKSEVNKLLNQSERRVHNSKEIVEKSLTEQQRTLE
jgi:hypothetical protein